MKRKQMRNYRLKHYDATAAWSAWNSARDRGARVPEGTPIVDVVTATIPIYREARELSRATGERWEVDHIVPIQRGGLHAVHNLQVVRRSFNSAKRRLTNDEVLEAVIAGEWQHDIGPEVLKIAKDHLVELVDDREEQDSLEALAAQGFLHRVETDPTYQPSIETIQAVFERLQGNLTVH
ncbi:HNH endonuclease [Microvirga yunnanensis]|uniref:HNH endonuclease n=1 Tax=Microvirga yunnanensis TaxID=2953740 RepID=UPI0021CAC4BE|nr:HNH endonuclease signature motif containing protein [Microvirga sp. HBU65207]